MISEKVVREKPVPEEKTSALKEMKEKLKKFRTVLISSCKGLPGQQYHEIKKNLRDKVEIKMAKKSLVSRAIDGVESGYLKNLKGELGADVTLFFSDLDPFELSGLLSENQSPSKARAGDIAPENIKIEPGPTELTPGPAISELGAVGLKVAVKNGKLEIMKGAMLVKAGEEISPEVANVLGKLDMKPMKVGFLPLAAYDSEDDKVYVGIKIDKEETLAELKTLLGKALGFAINMAYPSEETVSYFIAKASSEEKALTKLTGEKKKEESAEEEKPEEKVEEKPEEKVEEKPEEEEKKDSYLTKKNTKEEA